MSDMVPSPIAIHAVSFSGRWVEITWGDESDVAPRAMQYRQDMIDPQLVAEQLGEVQELLREMIDIAAIELRRPPGSFTRPQRVLPDQGATE